MICNLHQPLLDRNGNPVLLRSEILSHVDLRGREFGISTYVCAVCHSVYVDPGDFCRLREAIHR